MMPMRMPSVAREPGRLVLSGLWSVACVAMVLSLQTSSAQLLLLGQTASLIFILVLIVWLWWTRPGIAQTGTPLAISSVRFGYVRTLVAILGVVLLLFLIAFIAHPQLVFVTALTLLSGWLVILNRRDVSIRAVMVGFALSGVCVVLAYASERLDPYQAFYLACLPMLFVGGTLLTKTTGLGRVHCVDGHWRKAVFGFVGGCGLALPAALLNASDGAPVGDDWVTELWEPAVALVPGIAEETWARLFLLTLLFALFQGPSQHRPARALLTAVILAALIHALAHLPAAMVFGPAAIPMAVSALLFGVPMGLIFVKYGFEAAVGYHFFIDFIRFWAAFMAE